MRRVYSKVETRPVDGGWGVALDGRPIRTPARNELVLPTAALAVTSGILPASQSAAALQAFAAIVAAQDDFRLTVLQALTGGCGSLVIALALMEGRLDAEEAFAASQLDETFQIEAWGEDADAANRRQALAADIGAAARFLKLLATP